MEEKTTEKTTPRKGPRGFRIKPHIDLKLIAVAKKADRSESWVINQCLERALPILEKEVA